MLGKCGSGTKDELMNEQKWLWIKVKYLYKSKSEKQKLIPPLK